MTKKVFFIDMCNFFDFSLKFLSSKRLLKFSLQLLVSDMLIVYLSATDQLQLTVLI